MPLTGTGEVLGLAIQAARDAATTAFMADKQGRALTEAEVGHLRTAMAKAEGTAIVLHIVAFGAGSVVGAGPGFPGSIT